MNQKRKKLSGVQASLKGRIGSVTATHLSGWAMYTADSTQKVTLAIVVNNQTVGQVVATSPRADLKARNIHPSGECGYLFRLEKSLASGDHVAVVDASSGRPLGGSPVTYKPMTQTDALQQYGCEKGKPGIGGDFRFFFIHIPKTAGTSIRHMFYENFDQDDIFPNLEMLQIYDGYPSADVLRALSEAEKKSFRLFMGHYSWTLHRLLGSNVQKLVFLREPVSRAVSHLNHFKLFNLAYRDWPLTEIYAREKTQLSNCQVRMLTSDGASSRTASERSLCRTPQEMLAQAKVNLSTCEFVGITEQFSKSVELLKRMYGFNITQSSGENRRFNVTPQKQPVSDELLAQIREDNNLDAQLYQKGVALLTERSEKYS